MTASVRELTPTTTPLTRRLRTRQAHTRVVVAQRLVAEAQHPSRHAHVPDDVRDDVERLYREASTALRAAETLLEGAGA